MTIVLSTTHEDIDRAIYKSILNVCVQTGYSPDISNATLFPDTALGWTQYETAQDVIKANKGFCIEVFGDSNPDALGMKKIPRIVITKSLYYPGETGSDPALFYTANGANFDAKKLTALTSSANFSVHIIGANIKQMRILESIVAIALPDRGYIPRYIDPNYNILILKRAAVDVSDPSQGILEQVINYQIPDLYEIEPTLIEGGIPQINQVSIDVVTTKDLAGDTAPETGIIIEQP